jgi:hypothetical protein
MVAVINLLTLATTMGESLVAADPSSVVPVARCSTGAPSRHTDKVIAAFRPAMVSNAPFVNHSGGTSTDVVDVVLLVVLLVEVDVLVDVDVDVELVVGGDVVVVVAVVVAVVVDDAVSTPADCVVAPPTPHDVASNPPRSRTAGLATHLDRRSATPEA